MLLGHMMQIRSPVQQMKFLKVGTYQYIYFQSPTELGVHLSRAYDGTCDRHQL